MDFRMDSLDGTLILIISQDLHRGFIVKVEHENNDIQIIILVKT